MRFKKKTDTNGITVCDNMEGLYACDSKQVWVNPSYVVTKLVGANVLGNSFEGEIDGDIDDNEHWGDVDLWD